MSGDAPSRAAAAEQVLKDNPMLAHEVSLEQLDKELRKEGVDKARWPGEKWDQLVLIEDDQRFQVPDTPVRFIAEDHKLDTKPRRWATSKEAKASYDDSISDHDRATRRLERCRKIEEDTETQMHLAGFDITLTWDEIKHRDTVCARCGLGRIEGDPFVRGHTIARVVGGSDNELAWEHLSCNCGGRGNPQ